MGWHKIMLFPAPDFLSELLSESSLLIFINNGSVPIDYKLTTVADYLADFQRFFDLVGKGKPPDWRTVGRLAVGLTHAGTIFSSKTCKDPHFKLLFPSEPAISVCACNIDCDGNKFRTGIGARSEAAFGLEFTYPKVFSTDQDRHESIHSTEGLSNHQLWLKLSDQIKRCTRPLVATSPTREIRTRMRISPSAKSVANTHHLLQRFGFKVKG